MRAAIKFELIALTDVPQRDPIAKPAAYPHGSQWDAALNSLVRRPSHAIRVVEPDTRKCNRLKPTLQTVGKNRNLFVEIRTDGTALNAWTTKKSGRYSAPTKSAA
jgi:hypothetical protein